MRRALVALWLSVLAWGCDLRAPAPTTDAALASRLRDLQEKVSGQPTNGALRVELADVQAQAGQWFDAADNYTQAIDGGLRSARAFLGQADAYERLGYVDRGFGSLVRCVQEATGNELCLLRAAAVLRNEGSREGLVQAITALERFMTMAPTHPRRAEAERALREARVELASRDEKAGVKPGTRTSTPTAAGAAPAADPHGGAAPQGQAGPLNAYGQLIQRAAEAARNNDAPTAEGLLKEAVKQRPDDIAALSFLAETLLFQQKVDEAAQVAESAYKQSPKDGQTMWILGLVLIRGQKDIPRGVKLWQELVKIEPEYAQQVGVTQALAEANKLKGGP